MRSTTCAVVGGGPAGLVLGPLLARAGVQVTVLEEHADFLRDFRGDTVHPSTLDLLDDLGLFTAFDALPHSRVERVTLPGPGGGGSGVAVVYAVHTALDHVGALDERSVTGLRDSRRGADAVRRLRAQVRTALTALATGDVAEAAAAFDE